MATQLEAKIQQGTRFRTAIGAGVVASFLYTVLVAFIIFSVSVAVPNNKFAKAFRILFELENSADSTEEAIEGAN
jgi:uncharacterized paraquat-inducible protein A